MKGHAPPPTVLSDLVPRRYRQATPERRYDESAASAAPLDDASQARFRRLKAARSELAKERKLPAYCVCADKTLRAIATADPADSSALEAVKGMGPRKVAMYGKPFLSALRGEDDPVSSAARPAASTGDDGLRYVADAASEWPSDF